MQVIVAFCIISISNKIYASDHLETKPKSETWLQELNDSSPNWERDWQGWKNSPNWIRHKRADVPTTPQFANPLVEAWLKEIQASPDGMKDYEAWKNSPSFVRHRRDDLSTPQFTNPAVDAWLKEIQLSPNWEKDLEGFKNSPSWIRYKRSEESSAPKLSHPDVEV